MEIPDDMALVQARADGYRRGAHEGAYAVLVGCLTGFTPDWGHPLAAALRPGDGPYTVAWCAGFVAGYRYAVERSK